MPPKPTEGTLMRDVHAIGAYTTQFKKHPNMSFGDLAREAILGPELDPGAGAVPASRRGCSRP